MFNCLKFLEDYNIDHSDEGENSAPGWMQIQCPFCFDNLDHGGFNLKTGYYNCWKCGKHSTNEVITALLHVSKKEAYGIARKYNKYSPIFYNEKTPQTYAKKVEFPDFTYDLQKEHKSYLEKRGFDPDRVERKYKLKGTSYLGDYKFRIICPIFLEKKMISYQGRDITDKAKERYKACKKERQVKHHKHSLYNIDNANKESVIVVEGITDVWRLGNDSVALFGIEFTRAQAFLLAQKYKKVFILFDPGKVENLQAFDLGMILAGLGTQVEQIEIFDSDPGDLPYKEAFYLKKQLIGE